MYRRISDTDVTKLSRGSQVAVVDGGDVVVATVTREGSYTVASDNGPVVLESAGFDVVLLREGPGPGVGEVLSAERNSAPPPDGTPLLDARGTVESFVAADIGGRGRWRDYLRQLGPFVVAPDFTALTGAAPAPGGYLTERG